MLIEANRDDVNYFDSIYVNVTGSNTLALNVNWGLDIPGINMKLADAFTPEEKTAYVQKILSVRFCEDRRLMECSQCLITGKSKRNSEKEIEHDALPSKLTQPFPGNTWWGPDHSFRHLKDTVMHTGARTIEDLWRC